MQESKTPIYDAVTSLTADILSLSTSISNTASKFGSDMLDERELALHKLLVRRAPENAAARYLLDELQLASPDGTTRPLFGSWRYELLRYKVFGKKETITDLVVRGLPSHVGNHLTVVAMGDGIVQHAGRSYTGNAKAARRALHVSILHEDGVVVHYCQLGEIASDIKAGVEVSSGQVIAKVNNSDGCVVIDVRKNGRRINAAQWCGIEVNEE